MTASELCVAPPYKGMIAEMAKTHVSASDAQQYKIFLEMQQKESDDYCKRN